MTVPQLWCFKLGCHKKNEKCSKGLWRPHGMEVGGLRSSYVLVDFCGWRGWEGHKTNDFLWLSHTWAMSFRLEMKMFSYLSAEHISFYLLIFEFPFIMAEIIPFFGKGTSVVFRASNLFQIQQSHPR